MRSIRITALGIVVFLFLQAALFSCLRIGGKPKYDIDEDSLFFSRMRPHAPRRVPISLPLNLMASPMSSPRRE